MSRVVLPTRGNWELSLPAVFRGFPLFSLFFHCVYLIFVILACFSLVNFVFCFFVFFSLWFSYTLLTYSLFFHPIVLHVPFFSSSLLSYSLLILPHSHWLFMLRIGCPYAKFLLLRLLLLLLLFLFLLFVFLFVVAAIDGIIKLKVRGGWADPPRQRVRRI